MTLQVGMEMTLVESMVETRSICVILTVAKERESVLTKLMVELRPGVRAVPV